MRFRPLLSPLYPSQRTHRQNPSSSLLLFHLLNPSYSMASESNSLPYDPDEDLCAALDAGCSLSDPAVPPPVSPGRPLSGELRIERAWAHWNRIGAPKLVVAPMVDNSELPFRMLCRKYGAEAAYTPMLHSRIFSENEKYRSMEFTTCKMPTKNCQTGNYGAFLMDNLPLIKSLVQNLSANLHVPVSCKIRVFPNLEDTIKYAKMLEEAGCSLLAVHGRTRDEKDGKKFRADWNAIKAVKDAVRIPVLANGNIRHLEDVRSCLDHTGTDGVLSAESLLENPALFAGFRTMEWKEDDYDGVKNDVSLDQADLVLEYLKICEQYPVPWRMIRSHVHKMLGYWFRMHPQVREEFNAQSKLTFEWLYDMVKRLKELGGNIPLYGNSTVAWRTMANGHAAGNS